MPGHVVGHGLREVGIIGGLLRVRAEIVDRPALPLEMLLDRLLQLEAAVIRTERDGVAGRPGGAGRRGSLFDKFQHGDNALLNLVAAVQVNVIRPADRIANVIFINVQRLVKLAQQKVFSVACG